MKKRIYTLLLIAGIMAGLLSGCGKKQETGAVSDTEAAELSVFDYDPETYVTLGDYKNLAIEYPVPEVTDDDVQSAVSDLLDENTEYKEITDRGAEDGDSLNIDFDGTLDGEAFDGGSAEDYDFVLGDGEFLDEFETNLAGKKAGEEVTFPVTFPDDYSEDMGGKTAEFTVKVNSVNEVITPEYNDAFVAKVTDYDTTEAYEESLREDLLASAQQESEDAAGEKALTQAIANARISGYPQELYDICYADTKDSYQSYADMFGVDFDTFMSEYMDGEDLDSVTESWVNEILVSQAIADKEGFAVTEDEYQTQGASLAAEYGYATLTDFEEDYGKVSVMANLIREKTIRYLYEHAKVTEVSQAEFYGQDAEEIPVDDTEAGEDLLLDTETITLE